MTEENPVTQDQTTSDRSELVKLIERVDYDYGESDPDRYADALIEAGWRKTPATNEIPARILHDDIVSQIEANRALLHRLLRAVEPAAQAPAASEQRERHGVTTRLDGATASAAMCACNTTFWASSRVELDCKILEHFGTSQPDRPAASGDTLDRAAEAGHDALFDGALAESGIERELWRNVVRAVAATPGLLAATPASGDTTEQARKTVGNIIDQMPGRKGDWMNAKWVSLIVEHLAKQGLLADGRDRARIEKALAIYDQPTSEVSKLLLLRQIRDVLKGEEPAATEEQHRNGCTGCEHPADTYPLCWSMDQIFDDQEQRAREESATEEPTAASETDPTSEETK